MEIRADASGIPYRVGDRLRIQRTVSNLPTGETIAKAYLVVKERYRDSDGHALVNLSITPTSTVEGEVEDIGDGNGSYAVGTGRIRFDLLPKHTRKIGPGRRRFGIKIILSSGEAYTAEEDVIDLAAGLVEADS